MVRELPEVGRNLFDQLNVPVYVNLRERVSITLVKLQTVPEVFDYFAFGTGESYHWRTNAASLATCNCVRFGRLISLLYTLSFFACRRVVGH